MVKVILSISSPTVALPHILCSKSCTGPPVPFLWKNFLPSMPLPARVPLYGIYIPWLGFIKIIFSGIFTGLIYPDSLGSSCPATLTFEPSVCWMLIHFIKAKCEALEGLHLALFIVQSFGFWDTTWCTVELNKYLLNSNELVLHKWEYHEWDAFGFIHQVFNATEKH